MFRPSKIDEIIGNEKLKLQLKRLIAYAKNGEMGNVLFFGRAGSGKTTFCRCLANELGYKFQETVGTAISNIRDLLCFLSNGLDWHGDNGTIFKNNEDKIIYFIDEIHAVTKNQSMSHEIWLPLFEDKILFHNLAGSCFDLLENGNMHFDNKGEYVLQGEKDTYNNAYFIAGTTDPDMLNEAIRRRFSFQFYIDKYSVEEIAKIATFVNSQTENIGARRLYTIMELLLEDVSFTAPELKGQAVPITVDYVRSKLKEVLEDKDLSKYIL